MKHRITKLTALLFVVTLASAASVVAPAEIHAVPILPHGLDWDLLAVPNPEISVPMLSDAELWLILPRTIKLGHADALLTIGPSASHASGASVGPIIAMLAGLSLLLTAYELIPRAHSQILRLRSVNLSRDLFS